MKTRLANGMLAISSLVFCAAAAWSVSQFGWLRPYRVVVPFVFLALVLVLGFFYGRLVGILGSILSAFVFAHALFDPVGSFFVSNQSDRSALAWALLLGVSASYLLLPAGEELHKK